MVLIHYLIIFLLFLNKKELIRNKHYSLIKYFSEENVAIDKSYIEKAFMLAASKGDNQEIKNILKYC